MSKIKVYDFEERLIENLKNDPKYLKGFKNYIIKEFLRLILLCNIFLILQGLC